MKRVLTLLPLLLLTFTLAACGGDGEAGGKGGTPQGGGAAPAGGYDAEYTIVIDGAESWTPFAGGGAAFANGGESVVSITDDGRTVKFTGLAVGEAEITATAGSGSARALVKVVKRSEDGTQGAKRYLTYCEPVEVYCYEYEEDGELFVQAYDHKNYLDVCGSAYISFVSASGTCYQRDAAGEWILDPAEPEWDGWLTDDAKTYEWPLSEFANMIATYDEQLGRISNATMSELYEQRPEDLPDHRDVTKYYLRSETAGGSPCEVYQLAAGDTTYTYWVEPNTGFTLKYEEAEKGRTPAVFEVTSFRTDSVDFSSFGIGVDGTITIK